MRYWQVAAGALGRDYSEDFLRYGMAFAGERHKGMQKVRIGDRVILKHGMKEIVAVGTVVQRNGRHKGVARDADSEPDKQWLRDYDGWDLPAYFYVDWHRPSEPVPAAGLSRSTIRRVHQQGTCDIADEIIRTAPVVGPPQPEPNRTEILNDDQILDHLIREGLRPSTAEELTATLKRIRLLARYYYDHCKWSDVREHEARTFLIIPFLLALGWSEQQMKIELGVKGAGRIDVACFARAFRRDEATKKPNNDDCVLILESKGFNKGLDYAHSQGKRYAKAFPSCAVVVASNGYCYKAYRRTPDGNEFEDRPAAYLNLLRPTKEYPLDPENVDGGLKLLSFLLPGGTVK